MTTYVHRVFGELLCSDVDLGIAEAEREDLDGLTDVITVRIDSSDVAGVLPAGPDDECTSGDYSFSSPDGELVVMRNDDGVVVVLDVRERSLRILASGDPATTDLAHVVLDHAVPRLLAVEGSLVLHGSAAVTPDGRAVVLVGSSGSGKSTLGASLVARSGWSFLTDDGARIDEVDGNLVVWSSYPSWRLYDDSGAQVTEVAERDREVVGGWGKHRYVVSAERGAMHDGPAALGAVFVLGDPDECETSDVTVARLGPVAATTALLEHGFHTLPPGMALAPAVFTRCADAAARVAVYALSHPHDYDHLVEVHRRIDDVLERNSAG